MRAETSNMILALIVAVFILNGCVSQDNIQLDKIGESAGEIPTAIQEVIEPENGEGSPDSRIVKLNSTREVLEIPSEAERANLPECGSALYVWQYTETDKITQISPLGNVDPPAHTIPTNHIYTHFSPGGASTKTYELYAPADLWITHISSGFGSTLDPEDHTIYFAVCKDVIGYFNHVKKLAPDVQKIVDRECSNGVADNKNCFLRALEPVKAGVVLGEAGRLQGNFDFGTIDLRTEHDFINKSRYATRTLHIQCALDYYSAELKSTYYNLLARDDSSCGKIFYDVPGTLQGNWFHGDATEFYGGDWVNHAFFGYDNEKPELAVLSVGGVIVPDDEGLRWKFTQATVGKVNRAFADVTADGSIYCYDKDSEDQRNIGPKGRILVRMSSSTEMEMEHQSGSCPASPQFTSAAKIYGR